MTAVTYLRGCALLLVAIASLAGAGYEVRSWLVPAWRGAPARLAEAVVGLALLVVILEALGTAGWLRPGAVAAVVPAGAGAVALVARRLGGRHPHLPVPAGADDHRRRGPEVVALVLAVVVLAQWIAHASTVVEGGMRDMDSLRYHGPFAARWIQQHSLVHLQHTSDETQETFFPATSELLDAYGILLFGRDILLPFMNLGWFALGGLAACAAGAGSRSRAAALAGYVAVCSTPLLASIEPGSAKNDIAAAALVLAAAVLFRASHSSGAAAGWAIAGAAAGLAVGTKLTSLVPVAVLVIGALLLARGDRLRRGVAVTGAATVTGSYWYVRNLVHTGSPLPWLHRFGPFTLPGPLMTGKDTNGLTVLHYVGDATFWVHDALAGLTRSFGPLWPLLALGAAALSAVVVSTKPPAMTRVIAASGLAGAAAYLATPFSAGGPAGHPVLFALDLRFLAPSLMLAPLAVTGERANRAVVAAAAAVVLVDQVSGAGQWPPPLGASSHTVLFAAVVLASLVLLVPRIAARGRVLAVALMSCAIVGVGWPVQADELRDRYVDVRSGLTAAFVAFRTTDHLRIAVGGFADDYPLYGADLSNEVDYIGVTQPHGGFRPATTCTEWREALRAGRYDYVVVSRSPVARQHLAVEASWTASDPAAVLVLRRGVTQVFRMDGPASPGTCRTGSAVRRPGG